MFLRSTQKTCFLWFSFAQLSIFLSCLESEGKRPMISEGSKGPKRSHGSQCKERPSASPLPLTTPLVCCSPQVSFSQASSLACSSPPTGLSQSSTVLGGSLTGRPRSKVSSPPPASRPTARGEQGAVAPHPCQGSRPRAAAAPGKRRLPGGGGNAGGMSCLLRCQACCSRGHNPEEGGEGVTKGGQSRDRHVMTGQSPQQAASQSGGEGGRKRHTQQHHQRKSLCKPCQAGGGLHLSQRDARGQKEGKGRDLCPGLGQLLQGFQAHLFQGLTWHKCDFVRPSLVCHKRQCRVL